MLAEKEALKPFVKDRKTELEIIKDHLEAEATSLCIPMTLFKEVQVGEELAIEIIKKAASDYVGWVRKLQKSKLLDIKEGELYEDVDNLLKRE